MENKKSNKMETGVCTNKEYNDDALSVCPFEKMEFGILIIKDGKIEVIEGYNRDTDTLFGRGVHKIKSLLTEISEKYRLGCDI